MQSEKVRWAKLSVVSNSVLTILKIIVGMTTGSVSIVAEGAHSAVDLIASVITFVSVKVAGRKADKRHQYGHGKVENLAGVIEGVLIFLAAGYIIFEALPKLAHNKGPEQLGWGVGVMALSSLINFGVSKKLFSVAKKTDSPALAADAWHLRTDVYTSAGVLFGLVLIKLTGMPIFDPILALVVACFIIKAAWDITSEGLSYMVDASLPDDEMKKVHEAIAAHGQDFVEFHELRARKSGSQRFIDLHLVVPQDMPIRMAHDICSRIEDQIEANLSNSSVLIHPEPCGKLDCKLCGLAGATGCTEAEAAK
jgi:cation diffusion facilitator family transporter